jgi:hypothetical protein
MNPKLLPALIGLSLLLNLQGLPAAEADKAQLKQEAIGIIKKFGGSLKPELKKAIQAGGPAHAISVCSEKAPSIAQRLSSDSGWMVKRVSLKARNQSAVPDAWEQKVLQQFDARQASGESADKMAYAEIVDGKAALREKYPSDKARGYELGQIRGAFSLSRDL